METTNNIEQLKENIRQYIKQNGNKEITGQLLQEVLLGMVDGLVGNDAVANPDGEAAEILDKLGIAGTVYTAPQGPQGVSPTVQVTQNENGYHVVITDKDGAHAFDLTNGPANALTIGTVQEGDQAAANITGEAPNQQLNLTLPKGKQGDPGQNAVNPFKGWFTTANIPTTGQEGDYCNVSDTSTTPHTVTIYRWNTTTNQFEDTGEVPDTATGDTFASSETLQQVAIDDSHLVNPVNTADPNKPVLAKAEDVMQLKAKLGGVTANEEKFVDYTSVSGCWGKNAQEIVNTAWSRAEILLPSAAKNVRILGVAFRNGLSEENKNVANILGHYEGGEWVSDYIQPMDTNTEDVNITREYTYAIPSQSTHFRINTRYGSAVMRESSFYCYLQSGKTVGELIANLEYRLSKSIDDSKTYTNAAVGDNIIPCEAIKEYRLGPSLATGLLESYLSGEFSLHVIFLQHGEEALVKVSSDTDNLVVCTTAYPNRPDIGVAYENYERFIDLMDFAKMFKYDSDVYFCVMCPDTLKDVLSINKVTRIDTTNYSFVKLQPVRKELKINPDGNGDLYFTPSNAHYTYMSFIKKGSTVKIELSSVFNKDPAFFTFGTAPKFMPPYSMSSVSEMNGFEILKRYWMRRDSFYYTATNDCWIWCAFSKDTVNFSFSVVSDLNDSVKSNATPIVGSMNFHLQPDFSDDENITLQTNDIYAIYDDLASQHPFWLVKKDDIGVSSVGGIAIRHYEFGYQKRTMMYNYNNPEVASNNKLFNDQGINRDMRHILVDSGIHGDEKASVYGLAMAIKSILESNDDWAVFIKTNFIIDIVPVLSPDTFDANSRNTNYNGESLDPNRDYADFKLNETKAIVDLVLSVNPIAYIDCHNTNSNQYTNKKRMFLAAPKGCEYFQSVLDLSMRMSSYMSQALPASYNYPIDPKVWFLINENENERQATLGGFMSQLGIIAMTLESPRNLNYTSGSTTICTKRASTLMSSLVENVLPAVGSFVFK